MTILEQQIIFRSDRLFLFNNINIFQLNSNSFMRVQVRVRKKYFFEFKLEFGENDLVQRVGVQVQVRVRSPN